jgi:hydroxyacylglutathione hydrolase
MDDGVLLYPCHGAGSACGADIGDRMSSSIGYERAHNPFLQYDSLGAFKSFVLEGAPPEPRHYKRLKKINAHGPQILGTGPVVPALPPVAFKLALERGEATLIDTRDMLAFGGGHIPGAINIGAAPMLSVWAGWMLDPERPVLLVLERDADLEQAVRLVVRTGHVRFAGYLAGGMSAWQKAGHELESLRQMSVHELRRAERELQILDVRGPDEWAEGHIPDAQHVFVPEIPEHAAAFDRGRPVVTYCDSGYRASIAASLLQARGFQDVRNVPGSWQAWCSAGYPVADE